MILVQDLLHQRSAKDLLMYIPWHGEGKEARRLVVGNRRPISQELAKSQIETVELERADAGECELIVKGQQYGHGPPREVGFVYLGNDRFQPDRTAEPPLTDAALRQHVRDEGDELTYTCVPPGSGRRLGIDRDGDGFLDGDELAAGSDPADPGSTPRR